MLALILDILAAAWIIAAANGIGGWLIRRHSERESEGFRMHFGLFGRFIEQAAGFAVITSAIFFLGVIHQFKPPAVYALLGLSVLPLIVRLRSGEIHRWIAAMRLWRKYAWPLLVPTLFIIAVGFSTALSPEVRYDSITYHISTAMLYVVNRGHVEIPSSVLTYIPQNQQLLYALGLMLGSDVVARIIHWWFGVMLLIGTAGLARIFFVNPLLAAGGAFLVASFPIWLYLASSTYIDFGPAVYLLAAVGLIDISGSERRAPPRPQLWLMAWAGIFAGMAMGCKYTAIVVGFAPLLVMLAAGRFRFTHILLFATAALLVFSPWLIRNAMWTGNPLAPSFMKWLGPAGVPESTLNWPDIQAGEPGAMWPPQNIVLGWIRMFIQLPDYGNYLPWIALVLGLVATRVEQDGRGGGYPKPVVLLLIFLLVGYCLGVPLGAVRRDSRYVMAQVAILAVLIVFWGQRIWIRWQDHERPMKWAFASVVLALFVAWGNTSIQRFKDLGENLFPPINRDARLEYAAAHLSGYRQNLALGEVNKIIPFQGLVLGAGYPARVNYVLGGAPITPDFIDQNVSKLKPESLDALQRRGVRHLFGSITDELRKSGRVHEGQRIGGIQVWNIVN
ncbi:MAG: glycosyltransferase family 39 protein [Candidatus Sumerlaeaceae bacterium]|nr:glycosyltransferase family 39 protein [Candidatus Sumerlaeaceae bacterium]